MTGRRWGGRTRRGANEWHCNAVRGGAKNTYWHMGSDSQTGSETNTPASNQRGVIHASPGRNTHTYTLNHKLTHWIIKPIMLLPLLTVKLDYSTMNHSEFALAAFCILECSESNREQPLSTLEHRSSEQTNPAAILWPSTGGRWESCSVHSVLKACCGKYCFWVYPTLTCCWDSLQSVHHLKKRNACSLISSLCAVNRDLTVQHVLCGVSSSTAVV